jgi:hypothetical protein
MPPMKRRGLGDVARLLPVLGHAAEYDLADQVRVQVRALAQVFVQLFQQLLWCQVVQAATVFGS